VLCICSAPQHRLTKKDLATCVLQILDKRPGHLCAADIGQKTNKRTDNVQIAGGLSNRQKVKQKNLPQGARTQVMKRRLDASRSRGAGFKGRKSRFR